MCQELSTIHSAKERNKSEFMADKDRRVRLEGQKQTDKRKKKKKRAHINRKTRFSFNAMNYYEHRILENDFYQVPSLIMMKNDY